MKHALIVVITDHAGGAERIATSVARGLMNAGWKIDYLIVCRRLEQHSFTGVALPDGARVRYGPFRSWYLSFPFLPLRLIGRRYDFVFSTHVYTNAVLSRLRRWRLVQFARLVVRESTTVFDRFSGGKAHRFRWLYRAYGTEDLIVAQTEYMAAHVRPWLPERSRQQLRCLPNPVDSDAIGAMASAPIDRGLAARLATRTNVLFCGRLEGIKRPDIAIAAFAMLEEDVRKRLQLVLVGDGPLRPGLMEQTCELGIEEQVVFVGQMDNPFPVIARCTFGILTSEREGFPNVLLEMMVCGVRKIVTTPCAGGLDAIPGLDVCANHDPRQLAVGLERAVRTNEDCRPAYAGFVSNRSVGGYLTSLLGSPPGNEA